MTNDPRRAGTPWDRSPRVRALVRKVSKLRREPRAFVADLLVKRIDPQRMAHRAPVIGRSHLRHLNLAHGHEPLGQAVLEGAEYLAHLGRRLEHPGRRPG